jgi:hypothetical protein
VSGVTKRTWDDDEKLLKDLAEAVHDVGPLAQTVADQGRGVYSWRTVDEDLFLASLSFDSSVQQLSQTRSEPGEARVLVFSAAPLTVELEVMSDQIVGQLLPPSVGTVLVEASPGDAAQQVTADDRGFFLVAPLPKGPFRLRCDTPTGRVVTDWVVL